uniref:Enoyl-CoA hydratase n=1 Tax=Candidatus Kentrum sp. SD TaxID=2126332 RepID=A0A450Z6B6_9GAMM|nr:MAG: enoyl-CoA hydratase [Candidatus Kentron sp. SD]VFK49334.1 MAG: enoyl-CoA hydratase [Candidatus Kentron sp. SD]
MKYENILFERPEKGIHFITLNCPRVFNILDSRVMDELDAAIRAVAADKDARVLLITSAGKVFSLGADVAGMRDLDAMGAKTLAWRGLRTLRRLERLPVPTIAVVNGFCLGGGNELAMACDWILASDRAVFGQPEVGLGVIPGWGGTQRLSRRVGTAMAMEMITTGRNVRAKEAKRIGLVNHLYPAEKLMDEAMKTARSMAAKGPVSIGLSKEAIQCGQHMDLDSACLLENGISGLSFTSADRKEGMRAFLERRKVVFRNE